MKEKKVSTGGTDWYLEMNWILTKLFSEKGFPNTSMCVFARQHSLKEPNDVDTISQRKAYKDFNHQGYQISNYTGKLFNLAFQFTFSLSGNNYYKHYINIWEDKAL